MSFGLGCFVLHFRQRWLQRRARSFEAFQRSPCAVVRGSIRADAECQVFGTGVLAPSCLHKLLCRARHSSQNQLSNLRMVWPPANLRVSCNSFIVSHWQQHKEMFSALRIGMSLRRCLDEDRRNGGWSRVEFWLRLSQGNAWRVLGP